MPTLHGPTDPSLWLNRKAGYWEAQLLGDLDHTSNVLINLVTQINAKHIDPAKFEEAVRAMIYNEPNYRADVKKDKDGDPYWYPATDFSDIFQFIDQSKRLRSVAGYAGCWSLAEELVNKPLDIGVGKPLHKHYLVKRHDCYVVMNVTHHAAGDGTTTFRLLNAITHQYDRLVAGLGVELKPSKVYESAETMSLDVTDEANAKIDAMVEARAERARTQPMNMVLPMNEEEIAESKSKNPWINRTLHAVGTKEGFEKLRSLCKGQGITIGSFGCAAMFLSEAAVHIRNKGGNFPEAGIPPHYTDLVANLRDRLDPPIGEALMFCIAETTIQANIDLDSTLFGVAQDVAAQLKAALAEKKLNLFAQYKERWETGKYAELAASLPVHQVSGALPSNKVIYKYPTKFSWGEIVTIHSTGSYHCPFFSNQVLLYHTVNKSMCYSIVTCDGENNLKDSQGILDTFVQAMENADKLNKETGVMDFVKGF